MTQHEHEQGPTEQPEPVTPEGPAEPEQPEDVETTDAGDGADDQPDADELALVDESGDDVTEDAPEPHTVAGGFGTTGKFTHDDEAGAEDAGEQ